MSSCSNQPPVKVHDLPQQANAHNVLEKQTVQEEQFKDLETSPDSSAAHLKTATKELETRSDFELCQENEQQTIDLELSANDNLEQELCQVEEILPEYGYQESNENDNSNDALLLIQNQILEIQNLNLTPDLETAKRTEELSKYYDLKQELYPTEMTYGSKFMPSQGNLSSISRKQRK
ncbi:hypothetical protein EVAR_101494_1 [Eumeta japonica]|uniref:Uncharacterized protein n=1 Tax=Eumeta variegata TaxID=151549 RepID=A0A4C1SYK8_EUMVA|nr:hypothetical protein EVAR_101494_1 [Eumeta japonica]